MPSIMSKLYMAASSGSVERTLHLLLEGSADIDERCCDRTPLMIAAEKGYLRIIRVLIRFGAGISVGTDDGHTALHFSIDRQHLATSKALIQAGADLEAGAELVLKGGQVIRGETPLHLAAAEGFCGGIVALIKAGANIDSRVENGATPLYLAACCGKLEACRILLGAKANPLLTVGPNHPLDVAAQEGHLGVIQALVKRFGVDGCSDEGGTGALGAAAYMNRVDIVTFLCDKGVVDTDGTALSSAIEGRSEACMKLLVGRRGGHAHISEGAYVNINDGENNPLLCSFDTGRGYAPRIAKFLLDHGADAASSVRFYIDGLGAVDDTPLMAAKLTLHHDQNLFGIKENEGVDGLRGIIRLLQQEPAVHAVSWSWKADTDRAAASTTIRPLPAFKISPGKPRVLFAAMDRYCKKQDGEFEG